MSGGRFEVVCEKGADFAFTQISFDEQAVTRCRDRTGFEGQVYAGVVVLASDTMAIRLRELISRVPRLEDRYTATAIVNSNRLPGYLRVLKRRLPSGASSESLSSS